MFGAIGGILGIGKILLVVGALGSVLVTGYKMVNYIQVSEQNRITVELQKHALEQQNIVIVKMQDDIILRDKTVQVQLQQIAELNDRLKGISDNLDADANNAAAKSIKQVIDRLRALETPK
jgi:hypothetical protein